MGKGDTVPCGSCDSCHQFDKNLHPDYFEIGREKDEKTKALKKNISIEQITNLQGSLGKYSLFNHHTVALIRKADELSDKAKNALLKTLEEPNQKTIIILTANHLGHLPKTIISRCQVIKFQPVPYDEIFQHFINEKKDREESNVLANASYGFPGKAILFANDRENLEKYQTLAATFCQIISVPLSEKFKKLSSILGSKNTPFNENTDMADELLNVWIAILRDALLIKSNNEYMIHHLHIKKNLEDISSNHSMEYFQNLISNILESKIFLRQNINPKIILENILIHI